MTIVCYYLYKIIRSCPSGVIVKATHCVIVVSEFERHFFYYVHFWTNILAKDMNLLSMA